MTTTVQNNNTPEERLIKLEKEVEDLKKILHTLFGKTRKKVKIDETEIFRQQMNRLISNHNKKTLISM